MLLPVVFVLTLSSTVVNAAEHHTDWSNPAYHGDAWQHAASRADEALPFRWHGHHDRYAGERIYDRGWVARFPGLRAFWWRGESFWYHGQRVRNAVLFYNNSDELVGVGFMRNGVFTFIRDDHESFGNHDSFFVSWWTR